MKEKAFRLSLAIKKIDTVYLANELQDPISDAEYCFMYALDDGRIHSQKDICRDWLIPKTTINTIAKRYERQGLITFTHISGTRREMAITLTDAGKAYVTERLAFIYRAEKKALEETLKQYDESFIAALETYGMHLQEAFEKEANELPAERRK